MALSVEGLSIRKAQPWEELPSVLLRVGPALPGGQARTRMGCRPPGQAGPVRTPHTIRVFPGPCSVPVSAQAFSVGCLPQRRPRRQRAWATTAGSPGSDGGPDLEAGSYAGVLRTIGGRGMEQGLARIGCRKGAPLSPSRRVARTLWAHSTRMGTHKGDIGERATWITFSLSVATRIFSLYLRRLHS